MITSDLVRQRVRTLPSLPTTVVALGQAVADDRCSVDRILNILAKDPALSATMLRLANSVMYGGDQRVMDLRTAVMRLGFEALLNLGRTAAIIRSFKGVKNLDPLRLWQHCVAVGLVSKGICRLIRQNSMDESAYLAGLLHDIGKIALDRCFDIEYAPVVEAIQAGEPCLDAEFGRLGLTHAEVGAMVAEHWNFPPPMVTAIRDHHEDEPREFLPALVQLSDLLVRTRIPNGPADEVLMFSLEEHPAFPVVFGTSELDVERLTFSIDDELEHAVTFVKLAFQD
jgi:putative nucleotidyltransferase with HDIG domain